MLLRLRINLLVLITDYLLELNDLTLSSALSTKNLLIIILYSRMKIGYSGRMTIKPQDIVVLAKLISYEKDKAWTQGSMALELCLSPSQVNYALKRLVSAKLIVSIPSAEIKLEPIRQACEEFFIHGFKYIFPAEFGTWTRGIPTGYAAPSLNKIILAGNDPIPVWPHAEGTHKGIALMPLYPCVPKSIIKHPDAGFYDLLSLLDALRSGRARERNIAAEKISQIMKYESSHNKKG